ncbi:MAG: peptidylprolyl isomerase [Arenicella sp.]|jgi:peptidylprolyl isomerase
MMKIYLALLGCVSLFVTTMVKAEIVSSEKTSGVELSAEWRTPKAESVLLMQLDSGRVVIELAPQFAPNHVANIKQLVSDGYFDGSKILRSQDNYVVQWGDPDEGTEQARSIGKANSKLKVEFFADHSDLNFAAIESRDAYAAEVGFVDGFPVASDGKRAWLTHCYGMVGVSRGMGDDSGNGSGLYVVTGHAPRHLDRNVTLVGRVIKGMPLLSSLPRGSGDLGFFESTEETIPIKSIKLATSLGDKSVSQQIMDTNSSVFKEHVAKRTTRSEEWFLEPTGKIELCNVGVPTR